MLTSIRMPFLRWITACALLVPTTGCGATVLAKLLADAKPETYSQHGLEFTHPGDWEVETTVEDVDGQQYIDVTVEGPDSAIAFVQQIRPPVELDRDELMTMMTDELRKETEAQIGGLVEFQQGAKETISRTIVGSERTGIQSSFSLTLLGQRVPHTAHMFPFMLDDRTIVLYLQVADEDRADHVAAFDTLVDSLAVH
jgi:hypothetical protein